MPPTAPSTSLNQRIQDRTAVVGVIGLGYVGLPLVRAFWEAGFRVMGFDIDEAKIRTLREGRNYIAEIGDGPVREMMKSGRFEPTHDMTRQAEADALLICVPTPLGQHLEPDLSAIISTADDIAKTLRRGQLIVLESTTYPGTTRDVVEPRLRMPTGLRAGQDYFLAFSPEREDPGRSTHSTRTIPKVVGGLDEASADAACALYSAAVDRVVRVRSAEVAEAGKLLENIYRAVNIAMVNEMKIVLSAMGIDIWEVIDAARTKPFGFQPFYPGPGLGGHCIPLDPYYLTWKARETGHETRFIELAGEVNRAMPDYVIDRLTLALNERGKAVRGSRILVLGLAYKENIGDVRESPSLVLIERLLALGARVEYNDPHVPRTHRMRKHDLDLSSVPLSAESLASCDCVLVATAHAAYDWEMIGTHASLIVDTRNALAGHKTPPGRVIKA